MNLSYIGVVYDLVPGDYVIIRHNLDFMPDRVYITSTRVLAYLSSGPLTALNNNGDWYFDNTTLTFSYIGNNY